MAKKRFVKIPIQFEVRSNQDGLFLIPPGNLRDMILGKQPKRRRNDKTTR